MWRLSASCCPRASVHNYCMRCSHSRSRSRLDYAFKTTRCGALACSGHSESRHEIHEASIYVHLYTIPNRAERLILY
jgi:hypothetical protein